MYGTYAPDQSFRKERQRMRAFFAVLVMIPLLYLIVMFLTAWL